MDSIEQACKFILCVLLTQLGKTFTAINRIVTELVDACTFNKLKIDTLANFDIEYIFLNISPRVLPKKF